MSSAERIAQGLQQVRARIAAACQRAGRDTGSVRLLAASKFQSADAIRSAYALGQRDFGENYVQELVQKSRELSDLTALRWHLIGRLQTNKAKEVVRVHAAVQSVDSIKLCDALEARGVAENTQVQVLVQVNISGEPQKAGVSEDALDALIAHAQKLTHVQLRGLMAIPKPCDDPDATRAEFRRMRAWAEHYGLSELSMGMSDDLELAIEEGATCVRVGTAIFGARPQR